MHLAVVHNNVDQRSSIGKLASWAVQTALEADHRVTVVARDLEPELGEAVDWRPLYVPPKLHVVQWAAARKTVLRSLRGLRPDVLHVYQPQLASLASTWHVSYLSRVGAETDSLHRGRSVRDRIIRAQQLAVVRMEDHYLQRLSSRPTVLFCSEQMHEHFDRIYGRPPRSAILYDPAFPQEPRTTSRADARRRLGLPAGARVVGFLGGADERKGYRELLGAVAALGPETFLLAAGPRSDTMADAELGPRLVGLGMLDQLDDFWASVDVLAVPSRFDPFGMVVTEAAAQGVPSVVTDGVGAASLVSRHRAGLVCDVVDLPAALRAVLARTSDFTEGCLALTADVDATRLSGQLLQHWHAAQPPIIG
ncbi:MAG: glycosyl transferase group 1 [Frankiales bacterium]|nr:glycosyl transferase group 1 [Frankiales bacterium]